MIENLDPYPKYTNSNLPWLNTVPVGWQILRGKAVFGLVDIRSQTGREELLTVSAADGVVPRSQKNVTMFKAKSYIGHKLCWPDDLVVNSLWAWMQGLGVSRYHGLVSSAYSVYRPRPRFAVYARYFHYLLRSAAYKWELQTRSKGVWTSRLQLSDSAFMDMPILLPSSEEQAAIIRFLNSVDHRIERAIQFKKNLITMLNEQRQTIIQRAVTHGLDPTLPLKPSGIPWLGQIPNHWDVRRAKFVFRKIDIRSTSGQEELLTVSSLDGVVPRSTKNVVMFKAASYVGHKLCWPHDLVVNSLWAWARGLGFTDRHGIVSTAYGVYRLREEYADHWAYLNLLLRSDAYNWELTVRSKGIWRSRLQLTDDAFFDMRIVLPPKHEGIRIAEHIRTSTRGIMHSLNRVEREIDLLREYRTRLIADVVTGKLDVRAASELVVEEVSEVPAKNEEALEEEESESTTTKE